ncbi:MAG: AMP-binding protein [Candidatus Delongbacteria bacterium]|jgi:long-chain acyl-CoA synthetase|nr:AMP-binding protein [Candidatus Delongbacteria bacterium]
MICTQYLDKTAIFSGDDKISYKELFEKINSFAELYKGKKYSMTAMYSENRPEWMYAFFSGWKNKCAVVTVDHSASTDDVSYILNDSKPGLIFYSNSTKKNFELVKEKIEYDIDAINLDEIRLKKVGGELRLAADSDLDKTAVIIYTSGTTGSPKGVMLSFRNLIANVDGVSKNVPIFTHRKQTLILLPLHHIFPLAGTMLAPLASGGSIAMAPSMNSDDVKKALKDNQVNIMVGVPRFYELLYRGIKTKIDSSLIPRLLYRLVKKTGSRKLGKKIFKKVHQGLGGYLETMVSGGAALNPEVGGFFNSLGFDMLEGFGMTEAAPMITFTRPGNIVIGSPGQALPGVEIKIVDGEVTAKGPNIMKGYYNRPEETAEILKDGWLFTGDLGTLDDKGFLRITGRRKEIIVLSNGKNINPVELEIKLEKFKPFVKEAAVLMHNDRLHAIIVPDSGAFTVKGIKDISDYVRTEILPVFNKDQSSYKKITQFTIMNDDIPRTRLSKIQRFKLSELIGNSAAEKKNVIHPDFEEYKAVKEFLEKQHGVNVYPDHNIEYDLGLDSLGKIGFLSFIEQKFGVRIDEDKLPHFKSVKEIAEHIKKTKLWNKEDFINWTSALKEKVHVKLPKSWFTQNLFRSIFKRLLKIYFKFTVKGGEILPEAPFIIAPNHQSFIDGLFVASGIKRSVMKNTYFYAKKKHVNNGFLRFLAKKNNVIVMDIDKDVRGSIQKMAEVLKSGKNMIIFPEGTRSKDGQLGDFRQTFAILSKELSVPVVPVVINGAHKALPSGSFFPKLFAKISVEFLDPVKPEGMTAEEITDKVKGIIRDNLKI